MVTDLSKMQMSSLKSKNKHHHKKRHGETCIVLLDTVIFLQPVDTPPSLLQATGRLAHSMVVHEACDTVWHNCTSLGEFGKNDTYTGSLTNGKDSWKLDLQLDALFPTPSAALNGETCSQLTARFKNRRGATNHTIPQATITSTHQLNQRLWKLVIINQSIRLHKDKTLRLSSRMRNCMYIFIKTEK